MAELNDWAVSAANNNSSPPDGFPENMNYASVNNAAREVMAVVARHYQDTNGSLAAGGTANALTLASNATHPAYFDGLTFVFEATAENTGAATLSVGGLAATAIQRNNGDALTGGEMVVGGKYKVIYDESVPRWVLTDPQVGAGNFGVSGRLSVDSTEAVDLTDADAAFRVAPGTGPHLEMDGVQIQAKADAISRTTLNLNPLGGQVNIGEDAFGSGAVRIQGSLTSVRAQQSAALDVRNNADSNPTIGNAQNVVMRLVRSDGTLISQFGFPTSVGLFIDSYNHGGIVTVRGEDAGGTLQNVFRGNPGGVAQLYNAGTSQIETADETATNRITGGLIRQRDSVGLVPIGAALLSEKIESANFNVGIDHANRMTRVTGAATITLPDDPDLPLGAWGILINNSGGNRSINAGAGVTILSGGLGSGNRTLANNGVALWWHGHVDERYWLGNLGGLS